MLARETCFSKLELKFEGNEIENERSELKRVRFEENAFERAIGSEELNNFTDVAEQCF